MEILTKNDLMLGIAIILLVMSLAWAYFAIGIVYIVKQLRIIKKHLGIEEDA